MTPEMAKSYVKPIEIAVDGFDIDDYAQRILKTLEDSNHKKDAIIALLQDIKSAVNELIPFPD